MQWGATVLLLGLAARLPGQVELTPTDPDEFTDLVATCPAAADPIPYRWAVNGRVAAEGVFPGVRLLACDRGSLAAAGVRSAEALTYEPGRDGDGVRISAASPLVLPAAGEVTEERGQIRFWFRPDWNGDDGARHRLFEARSAGGNGFFIEKEAAPYEGLVFYLVEPGLPGHGVWMSGKGLRAGEWVHVGIAWDLQPASGGPSRLALYVNGRLVNSTPSNPGQFQPRGGFTELRFGGDTGGSADAVLDSLEFLTEVPAALPASVDTTPDRALQQSSLQAWHFAAGDRVAFTARVGGEEETVAAEIRAAPGDRDQFGGWRDLRGRTTGAFHCEQLDGRWWMITPEGSAFYALGTDHCRFGGHFCEKLGYAPYERNNLAKYGGAGPWIEQTLTRLRDWQFNLLAAGDDESLRHRGLAHTEFVAFGTIFAGQDDIVPKTTWTGFPNVFSPQWEEHCDRTAAAQCAPNVGDSWLLGYFLDNELEWYGKTGTEAGIFLEAMKKPAEHTAKQALVALLKQHHDTIEGFNRVWGTTFGSWEELAQPQATLAVPASAEAERDWRGYLRLVADRYFAVTTAAIRKHDPEHMVIGCRFAGQAPGIWDLCGKYCDVVTFNYYGRVDLETGDAYGLPELLAQWHAQAGKPMMITEWSFPALDSGLPCTAGAGMRVDTQAQRARCFEVYQTLFERLPFMVGSDFFMWVDEPAPGISSTFPEDSNYGLVNERDEPYAELTAAARTLQGQVYAIHAAETAELSVRAKVAGTTLSVTVANAGRLEARPEVDVIVDGLPSAASARPLVPGGQTVTLELLPAELAAPEAHLVVVRADAERRLPDPVRTDNEATVTAFTGGVPPGVDAVLLVANPGLTDVRHAPLVVSLGACAGEGKLSRTAAATVHLTTAAGEPVPFQVDRFSAGPTLSPADELAFLVDLPPQRCVPLLLRLEGPLREPSDERPFKFVADERSFEADNGTIRLAKQSPDGTVLNVVEMEGTPLGNLIPLMWEEAEGRSWWARPDTLLGVRAQIGMVRAVADVDLVLAGPGTGAAGQAARYRCGYRVALYRDVPWFTSQLTYVESTDPRPWRLRAYFHFADSAIGGSREGDEPGIKVPNYYLNLGVWTDQQQGWLYGVLPPERPDCEAHFWTDAPEHPESQHADARRTVDVAMQQGTRYEEPQPEFIVFGARAEGAAPWAPVVRAARQREALSVRVIRR